MSFRLDHVVILVRDLAAAIANYSALGFTVTPGGEHSDGATHNALVAFADGSYLELIAFKREAPEHRWWRYTAAGEGLIDWALLPSDIAADIAAASARGVEYVGPTPGGRLRPDGQELHWQTGLPPASDLPFLCADVTPRTLRVPQGDAHQHPNGVTGIAELIIGVEDIADSGQHFQALLDTPLGEGEAGGMWAAPSLAFQLGETRLTLVGPDGAVVQEQLAARGQGPHALVLASSSADSLARPDLRKSHGVPIEFVATG